MQLGISNGVLKAGFAILALAIYVRISNGVLKVIDPADTPNRAAISHL